MSEPSNAPPDAEEKDVDGAGQSPSDVETLSEEDYALGRTSDPDGAEREEPAGEDYAGSGF